MTLEEAREFAKKLMSELSLTTEMEDELKRLVDSIDGKEDTTEKDERIAELEKQLTESKQRYIDRFFDSEVDEKEVDEKDEVEEIEDEEVKEIDELFN